MSPLYVPLLFLLLVWLDRHVGVPSNRDDAKFRRWVAISICLWLFWPFVDTVRRVVEYREKGIRTYSTQAWAESRLMHEVSRLPSDQVIYSNAPDAIYIRTGKKAKFSPYQREEFTLKDSYKRIERFSTLLESDSVAYLAWFSKVHRAYLYPVEVLQTKFAVDLVKAFPDGSLYRISSRPALR